MHHIQIDRFEGDGKRVEVLQYHEAKWGDHDNDNIRSALAGGLLWLMDALIISKQELHWFVYASVRTLTVCFRSEITCKNLLNIRYCKEMKQIRETYRTFDKSFKKLKRCFIVVDT